MNTAHFNLTREKSEQVEDPRDDGKTLEANDTNTSHNLRRVYSRLTRTVCINVLNQWYQYHSEHPVLLYYLSSIQSWRYWLCFHHGVKLLFLQDKRAKFLSASVSVRNARKVPVFLRSRSPIQRVRISSVVVSLWFTCACFAMFIRAKTTSFKTFSRIHQIP